LARIGLIPDPCGAAASTARHWPGSRTPASSHRSIKQSTPAVGDPVRQLPHQPSVVDAIEEGADVDVEHEVHALRHQGLV
jgi:hypothetical protein